MPGYSRIAKYSTILLLALAGAWSVRLQAARQTGNAASLSGSIDPLARKAPVEPGSVWPW